MSIPCNVVLLPSDDLAQKSIALSQGLAEYDSLFTLEMGTFYPHITMYMLQLLEEDMDQVQSILQAIATAQSPLELTATTFAGPGGYIDIEYEKTKEISQLQKSVVEQLNDIRDGMRSKDAARLRYAKGAAKENLEKYGFTSIGELYRPHITLTRFASDHVAARTTLKNAKEYSSIFSAIGLFEMGDNGTCVRKIAEYSFV